MRIGIYVAHDDDSILGVGGRISQCLKKGDEVYIVIFTDGRNSHKEVLGIEKKPTVLEVKKRRIRETRKAMDVLGVARKNLFFLNLTDGEGKVWQNTKEAYDQAMAITRKKVPDIIYFHYPDAHPDHQAVNKVVFEILGKLKSKPEAYRFFIWTKELAKGRSEVFEEDVPEIPKSVLKVNVKDELDIKRKALYKMRSQILKHPYKEWRVQETPILDKNFIDYFLSGEELFIGVDCQNHQDSYNHKK